MIFQYKLTSKNAEVAQNQQKGFQNKMYQKVFSLLSPGTSFLQTIVPYSFPTSFLEAPEVVPLNSLAQLNYVKESTFSAGALIPFIST